MIQRFCFVKLSDAHVSTRAAFADALRAELADAGADAVVGLPADSSAARWDLALVITCASLDAWTALAHTPALIAILDSVAARAAVVKSWTFEMGTVSSYAT